MSYRARKTLTTLLCAMAMATAGAACRKPAPSPESTTKQLAKQDRPCQPADPGRTSMLLDGNPNLFQNFDPQSLQLAKSLVASLPVPYIQHLMMSTTRSKFRISLTDNVTSCSTQGGDTSWVAGCTSIAFYPTFSDVRSDQIKHAIIHELGHGLVEFVGRRGIQGNSSDSFDNQFSQVFQLESNNGFVASYAKNNESEYFAEAFSSFYCSPSANAEIQANLPQTYSVLRQWLLPPSWEDPGMGSGGAMPSGVGQMGPDMGASGIRPPGSTGNVFAKVLVNPTGGSDRLLASTPGDFNSMQLCFSSSLQGCANPQMSSGVIVRFRPSNMRAPNGMRIWETADAFSLANLRQATLGYGGMLFGVIQGAGTESPGRLVMQFRPR